MPWHLPRPAAVLLAGFLLLSTCLVAQPATPPDPSSASPIPAPPGVPFTAGKLSSMLPGSVYFQGKTAMLQSRNAGGTSFANGAIVWAALVDSSGYSSSMQEKFQFYLVTEASLRIGDARLAAGAYGGGFVGDRFLVMDLGGHTVAQGTTEIDAALTRPRPLQILPVSTTSVRLLLGRRSVTLQADPSP